MIPHRHTRRVYFADTDAGGMVYYGSYLAILEEARTEALRVLGLPHAALVAEYGRMFVVRRAAIDYLSPARLDDLLTVTTESLRVTAATAALRQTVTDGGTALVVAEILLACVVRDSGRAARIPSEWRHALG